MRFGGHETFWIREGWLYKGLKLLKEEPEKLVDEYAADWLGVGRNMAKSIRHWLLATGLATKSTEKPQTKTTLLEPSQLGDLVFDRDPYFAEIGTWWMLHANLVNNPEYAATWSWFFNRFNLGRFEKPVCLDSLYRYLETAGGRIPRRRTVERDLGCMLGSYARVMPAEPADPEDARECPLSELDILHHFRSSGYYHVNTRLKPAPSQVFGYVTALSFPEKSAGPKHVDLDFEQIATRHGGPGKVFAMTADALFELVSRFESRRRGIEIVAIGGKRSLRVEKKSRQAWMESYYDESVERDGKNAA